MKLYVNWDQMLIILMKERDIIHYDIYIYLSIDLYLGI